MMTIDKMRGQKSKVMIMQDINFRGCELEGKKFFYGDLLHDGERRLILTDDGSEIAVDPNTIGQFTGFYDCNGNSIFKDDILQNLLFPEVVKQVGWYHGCWVLVYEEQEDDPNILFDVLKEFPMRVIGNVFENPELLEVGG